MNKVLFLAIRGLCQPYQERINWIIGPKCHDTCKSGRIRTFSFKIQTAASNEYGKQIYLLSGQRGIPIKTTQKRTCQSQAGYVVYPVTKMSTHQHPLISGTIRSTRMPRSLKKHTVARCEKSKHRRQLNVCQRAAGQRVNRFRSQFH